MLHQPLCEKSPLVGQCHFFQQSQRWLTVGFWLGNIGPTLAKLRSWLTVGPPLHDDEVGPTLAQHRTISLAHVWLTVGMSPLVGQRWVTGQNDIGPTTFCRGWANHCVLSGKLGYRELQLRQCQYWANRQNDVGPLVALI